jgi:hypothetical protein
MHLSVLLRFCFGFVVVFILGKVAAGSIFELEIKF